VNVPRFDYAGYVLIEGDIDLFGRVCAYKVEGTDYSIVRTSMGWRARRIRTLQGPPYESAPAVIMYLKRQGYLR
jgi:hypothetical protein